MTNPPQLKAVAFDLDGLMFNTEDLYWDVGSEILRRRGCQLTTKLTDEMTGRRSHVSLQIMIDWHSLDDTVEELQRESEEIFDQFLEERVAPMPGLLDLINALERDAVPMAIATSSGRAFVRRVLSLYNFEPRFHAILTAEDVSQGKPDPEIYLSAASRLNVNPPELLVLEDSQIGCRAATAAGAFAIAVPGNRTSHHDFSSASMIAKSLSDLRIYQLLRIC